MWALKMQSLRCVFMFAQGLHHGDVADSAYGNTLPKGSTASANLTVANLTQVSIPTWSDPSQRTHAFSNTSPSRSSITRLYHYEDPRFVTLLTGISVQGSGSDGDVCPWAN